jgi:hypothetical protein
VADAGAVFLWAFGGGMKSKSPPNPPSKRGEKKHLIFLTVNDETRPLEIPNKPPSLKGGGGDLLSFRKTVLVATQGRFFYVL